jgi:hypothetical protein
MARPTKYNKELLEKARLYLNEYTTAIPSIVGLAQHLGVSRASLYNWGDEQPEFLDILDNINQQQELVLLDKGLTGDFNAAITKLALGKHGYSEKSEREITGKDGGAIEIKAWEILPVASSQTQNKDS